MTDVCLCAYMSHGHCGVVTGGVIDNDKSLPLLAQMALAHAEAGADFVAPSDMMDGRVQAIRETLDKNNLIQRWHFVLRGQIRFRLLWAIQGGVRFASKVR